MMISGLCFLVVVAGTGAASIGRPKGVGCNTYYGIYNTSFAVNTMWSGFSIAQKTNARKCGFDQKTWDGPSDCISCWSDLSKAKQHAMSVWGSTAACYDSSMTFLYGLNCTSKPASSDCDVSLGVLKTSRVALMKPWSQVSTVIRTAAATCGISQRTWDGPSECRACFGDLSPSRKQAVLSFDTDAECWDQYLFTIYGIDCMKLMRDTTNQTKRSALYARLSQASTQLKFQVRRKITKHTPSVVDFSQIQLVSLSLVGFALVFSMGLANVFPGNASRGPQGTVNFNDDTDHKLGPLLCVESQPLE